MKRLSANPMLPGNRSERIRHVLQKEGAYSMETNSQHFSVESRLELTPGL